MQRTYTKVKSSKVRSIILNEKVLNANIVGKHHGKWELAGINVPKTAKIVAEVESTDLSEPYTHEKLSPI